MAQSLSQRTAVGTYGIGVPKPFLSSAGLSIRLSVERAPNMQAVVYHLLTNARNRKREPIPRMNNSWAAFGSWLSGFGISFRFRCCCLVQSDGAAGRGGIELQSFRRDAMALEFNRKSWLHIDTLISILSVSGKVELPTSMMAAETGAAAAGEVMKAKLIAACCHGSEFWWYISGTFLLLPNAGTTQSSDASSHTPKTQSLSFIRSQKFSPRKRAIKLNATHKQHCDTHTKTAIHISSPSFTRDKRHVFINNPC